MSIKSRCTCSAAISISNCMQWIAVHLHVGVSVQLLLRMQHCCATSFLVCAWVMAEAVSYNCTTAIMVQCWTMVHVSMAEPTLVSHEYLLDSSYM